MNQESLPAVGRTEVARDVLANSNGTEDAGKVAASFPSAGPANGTWNVPGTLNEGSHPSTRPAWPVLGLLFASTILVSAFLLFQVQPLISKYILPWFGGSPSVWTTCMLFFQVVLFAGYAYAHFVSTHLSHKAQGIIHMALIALAIVAMLPSIAPAAGWKPPDSSHPASRILLLLVVTVGLPYFVLSTTGPLVQSWFARTWPGRSPYRLYALSNVGSLAALVTYPFIFEPAFGSDTQAGLWTGAFGLFGVLGGLSAVWIFGLSHHKRAPSTGEVVESAPGGVLAEPVPLGLTMTIPSPARRVLWIGLPAIASLLLLATTNFVTQDVTPVPFLWVVPLALYLLTFIISFDHPRWYRPLPMSLATLVLAVLAAGGVWYAQDLARWLLKSPDVSLNFVQELALYFTTMFFACLMCHGQLVRLRPDPRHLTEYYLLISAGGALGGIFVSLIAPLIFKTHFEWTIALGASIIVAATVAILQVRERGRLTFFNSAKNPGAVSIAPRARTAGDLRSVAILFVVALAIGCGGFCLYRHEQVGDDLIYAGRDFYGTVSVYEVDKDDLRYHRRSFFSGSTVHGKQLMEPDKRREPISYFSPITGVGRTLTYYQKRPTMHVGVVGMGIGVLAAYVKPGQSIRFYEINDQVDYIAHNYFSFLKDCESNGGKVDVVLADGRLALEQEVASGHPMPFDVLCLDAFTGDAPPVHLLTEEAFAIYLKHLQPDGAIVVNITNHYINLVPVVNAAAKRYGLGVTRVMTRFEGKKLLNRTDYMMLSKNQDFLVANPPVLVSEHLQPEYEVPLWTDKYSNLFRILKKY